jgi:hypothetical protein
VANPKCGTCRFFQENDLPGSGWCHHPQRKVSSDVKILVRRSELACRDDWSRHLWQSASGDATADPGVAGPSARGPLLPASPESLRAVLSRNTSNDASGGEDVLLSEGRIVSESAEPWQPVSRPFPAGSFDPRTAIFKAREAYREKIRASAMATRQSAAEVGAGTFDRAEAELRLTGQSQDLDRSDIIEADHHAAARNDAPELETEAIPIAESVFAAAGPSAGEPDRGPADMTGSDFWAFEAAAVENERFDNERFDNEVAGAPEPQADVCAPDRPAILDERAPSEYRRQALVADLPGWFRADLPRVCRMCRDFRPGADGQHGWCANAWAFTHRQLVQEEDPAPCHSAIGDWWAPIDDVWLVAADVSSHGRPTPLLDRMTGVDTGQRRRS